MLVYRERTQKKDIAKTHGGELPPFLANERLLELSIQPVTPDRPREYQRGSRKKQNPCCVAESQNTVANETGNGKP